MAEPVFLPWNRPFLPQVARWLTRTFGTGGRIDLREVTVVVPGRRGGRRLLELLVEEGEESERVLLPPREIITPGELPERLYRPFHQAASPAQARRAWALALDQVPRSVVGKIVLEPPPSEDVRRRAALARNLEALNREVGTSGRTFSEVAATCREAHLLFSDEERWDALARVQEVQRTVLGRCRRVDREEARRRALEGADLEAPGPVVLAGVVDLSPLLRRMLGRVRETVTPLVHAPIRLEHMFDELGTLAQDVWMKRGLSVPDEVIRIRDRPPEQATAVLEVLHELEGAFAPEEITLGVTREDELVPFLEQRLSAYRCPHRSAGGHPLERTGPFRLLAATADLMEEETFSDLAQLVRHPAVSEILQDDALPEVADEYFVEHLSYRIPEIRGKGGRFRTRLGPLFAADLLGRFQGRTRLSLWMPAIMDFLGRFYGTRSWNPRVPEEHRVVEACRSIQAAAQDLHEMPDELDEECGGGVAIRLLLGELRGEALPPPARAGALEIVGWLELHLDDAPVLILTGVNEPYLPETLNAHPFLPNALRTFLELEDNDSRFVRDLYRLTAILESRREEAGARRPRVRLVTGRRTVSGDPLRPSRLLLLGEGEELPRRLLALTEGREAPPSGATPLIPPLGALPALRSSFSLPPEEEIPLPDLPRPLRVTELGAILDDPYVWALERVRGVEETGDEAREMDPLLFGTLAHRVLELFGRSPEASTLDPEEVEKRLAALLDRIVKDRFDVAPLPTVPVQVAQLKRRFRAFARWHTEWVSKGWRIHATEARTPAEGVPLLVDGRPVVLSGRIDRIDRNVESGALAVLDYKTGEKPKSPSRTHGGPGKWKDLQLPLYRHLLGRLQDRAGHPLALPDAEARVHLGYIRLSGDPEADVLSLAPWTDDELDDALETARELLRSLIRTPSIPFDPERTGRKARGALAALLGRGILAEGAGMDADWSTDE